ncbi:hypothetical protein ACFP2F_17380 [Hymenobacter artigasi]|uniref:XRE family transcriptional regulator n=1 Tax=Hymenobacter artigasi TaxID=2719616 RepID=A0ABX1HM71_9BACT|nr:hypothetical protein [Hymenobacter artigasi]NKI91351.1 hypothetical protein [Hymenobacter artigasi]
MLLPDLPPPHSGPHRISFAHTSLRMVEQALIDANARRERHFPALSSATWSEVLRQLQPDVLVHGTVVIFDWEGLARRVQGLAWELPSLALPMDAPTAIASTADEELQAYQRQAVAALAEMQENAQAYGPLTYALLMKLAHGHPPVATSGKAVEEVRQDLASTGCPPVPEPFLPLPIPAEHPVDSSKERRQGVGLAPRLSKAVPKDARGPALRRKKAKQRTFRDIVAHHPRGNDKFGFTVRELCRIMRVSAASLTEARKNPGHLSVEKVMALAEAMGEHPLRVLLDIATEAASKKRRMRKKRVTPLQQLANSPVN